MNQHLDYHLSVKQIRSGLVAVVWILEMRCTHIQCICGRGSGLENGRPILPWKGTRRSAIQRWTEAIHTTHSTLETSVSPESDQQHACTVTGGARW